MQTQKKIQSTLFVISGVSGAGKSEVTRFLLSLRRPDVRFSRSCTTRPRRIDDSDNSYEFVTNEEFTKMSLANAFVEQAEVHGNFYGTPRKNLVEPGVVILDIDVQGCHRLHQCLELKEKIVSIFLKCSPPDMRHAFNKRLDMAEEDKNRRSENAAWEIQVAEKTPGLYTKVIESRHGEIDRLFKDVVQVFPEK